MAAERRPAAVGPLRQRLFTAFLLGPLVLLAVLLLPTPWFASAMALVVGLGAWEWAGFVGPTGPRGRALYVAALMALLLGLWFLVPRAWDSYLLGMATLWWLVLAVVLMRTREVRPAPQAEPLLALVGMLVLVGPWLALTSLHAQSPLGPASVVALLLLIWFADSAAYFAGRRWGRRKLAPLLSPGKTWAGLYGGVCVAALWGGLLAVAAGLSIGKGLLLVLICGITALVSVIGDLYESLLKRRRGLKDAGALLPGHGGILDRIDSTTAAAPVFVVGLLWLQGVS